MPELEQKPKRPWGGFDYLVLVIIAFLAAYFLVWPMGKTVASVFQHITNALRGQ